MDDIKSINWFPGHMRKALNDVQENLKLVDIVYETCDARIPFSSRNPELDKIIGNKPRVVILNKSDLADPDQTRAWIDYLKKNGVTAVALESTKKKGLDNLWNASKTLCADLLERAAAKGRIGRPIRAMVVGVPNTGKSTLINALCGRKVAVTGDKPGVTRAPKWVKTEGQLELMDMPGVLWPKIATKRSQLVLTATGAVKQEVTDSVEIAYETIKLLLERYPSELCERFKFDGIGSGNVEFIVNIREYLFGFYIASGKLSDAEEKVIEFLREYAEFVKAPDKQKAVTSLN